MLFIGTQFSILYTSPGLPGSGSATVAPPWSIAQCGGLNSVNSSQLQTAVNSSTSTSASGAHARSAGVGICQHQRIRSKECSQKADESMPDELEELGKDAHGAGGAGGDGQHAP